MTDVFERDVWKPYLARAVAEAKEAAGRDLFDEERDAAVFASLDILPVPVLSFPYDPVDPVDLGLGWVGESLDRLIADGRLRDLRMGGRWMIVRAASASAHPYLTPRQEQQR